MKISLNRLSGLFFLRKLGPPGLGLSLGTVEGAQKKAQALDFGTFRPETAEKTEKRWFFAKTVFQVFLSEFVTKMAHIEVTEASSTV